MIGVKVEKSKENLVINWQLSKIEIPIKEINEMYSLIQTMGERKKVR